MGAVYLATDTQLDRRVALKVLSPELAEDEQFRGRFMTESRTAASLDHPNIVPVFEAGETDGRLFIAMRYVDGHDLSDVLAERGALPIPLALRILTALAAALDAAHAKGLVHRDVKPGNVLITGSDDAPQIYLTDFGLTKRVGDQSLTRAGQIVGSIQYVAPEQVEGRPVDARTDVYSLGCLAFEILSGTPPFQRDSEMATLMAHVQDPPPSLLSLRPEFPEALDAAVAQAMAKDPANRFASAGEFAAAITNAARTDSGALTRGFLFADLRDYTAYVEAHGDSAASALLDVYRRMMRDTIARHGGAEIKTEGDSFYVVFPSASGAVMCGLATIAAAAGQSLSDPEHAIRVGVGVHAGESVAGAEGYVGSAVNIAARVCALAKPGEVVVTETVRSLTRTSGRLTFVPLGRRTLKGISEPFALFRAEPVGAMPASGRRPTIWRRRWVLAGVGGVLMLGILVAVAMSGVLGPGGSAASASQTPSGTEPTETLAPGETPASIPLYDHDGALDAGTYFASAFQPQVQFRLPSGWVGGVQDADILALEWGDDSGIFLFDALVVVDGMCLVEENFHPLDSPLALIDFLRANTNLVASAPVPKTVGGSTGYSITISNARLPSPDECPTDRAGVPILRSADNDYWVDDDHVVSVIALAVRDHTLAIFIESPPESTLSFQVAAESIVASFMFPEN